MMLWIKGLAILTVLLVAGCSRNEPVFVYTEPMRSKTPTLQEEGAGLQYGVQEVEEKEMVTVKRLAKHHHIDYVTRFTSACYFHGSKRPLKAGKLSEDESRVFEEYGQPEFQRYAFTSQFDEKTREWLYMEEDLLFQFIGGQLVYTGEVTDYERILTRRGYPDKYLYSITDLNPVRQVLIYREFLGDRVAVYGFADGRLVTRNE